MKSSRLMKYAIATVLVFTEIIQAQLQRNALCKKLSRSPNFNLNYVVGQPWRFYYTWRINMRDTCLDMTVTRATKKIIDRVAENMFEYMIEDLEWEKATMLTSLAKEGGKPREMLLFQEKGNPGAFRGVPNVPHEDIDLNVPRQSVPTASYIFKLFNEGKFLLMTDCGLGLAALMARVNQTIYRSEVMATASEIWEIDGYPSCLVDINPNEIEGSSDSFKDTPKYNKIVNN